MFSQSLLKEKYRNFFDTPRLRSDVRQPIANKDIGVFQGNNPPLSVYESFSKGGHGAAISRCDTLRGQVAATIRLV